MIYVTLPHPIAIAYIRTCKLKVCTYRLCGLRILETLVKIINCMEHPTQTLALYKYIKSYLYFKRFHYVINDYLWALLQKLLAKIRHSTFLFLDSLLPVYIFLLFLIFFCSSRHEKLFYTKSDVSNCLGFQKIIN